MRWLPVMVCVLLSCGATSKCDCDSTLSVSVTQQEYALFEQGTTDVTLCLEAHCYDFTVTTLSTGVFSKDKKMTLTIFEHPPRLLFISKEICGDAPIDVSLKLSRSGQELANHSWSKVTFSPSSQSSGTCLDGSI